MITRNFKNLIQTYFYSNGNTSDSVQYSYYYKDLNGENQVFIYLSKYKVAPYIRNANLRGTDSLLTTDLSVSPSTEVGCLLIGTNDTTETYDDYNLELVDSSKLQHINVSSNITQDINNSTILTITRTFRYIGDESIEIKECGLYKGVWNECYENSFFGLYNENTPTKILMARSVLETPRMITKNQVFTITMTLEI